MEPPDSTETTGLRQGHMPQARTSALGKDKYALCVEGRWLTEECRGSSTMIGCQERWITGHLELIKTLYFDSSEAIECNCRNKSQTSPHKVNRDWGRLPGEGSIMATNKECCMNYTLTNYSREGVYGHSTINDHRFLLYIVLPKMWPLKILQP